MNSQRHVSGTHSGWNRAINIGYGAITSTIRRLATMGHSNNVQLDTHCSRRMGSARATQQVPHRDVPSHSDGVVSFATGFDQLERILDAHRRDRVSTEMQLCDEPKSNDSWADSDDVLPEMTGVWFKQGQRYGKVDLARGPK